MKTQQIRSIKGQIQGFFSVLPAWAGMILIGPKSCGYGFGFTRMSGDDPSLIIGTKKAIKFYPHERGWSFSVSCIGNYFRVLPAWAGMILSFIPSRSLKFSFTRMSGDDPPSSYSYEWRTRFYPHERGWSFGLDIYEYNEFVLPAWAGMILSIHRRPLFLGSFTRMSGDDPMLIKLANTAVKFYPHERGWSFVPTHLQIHYYVLPAWAGMILASLCILSSILSFTRMSGDDPTSLYLAPLESSFYPHERGWSSDTT